MLLYNTTNTKFQYYVPLIGNPIGTNNNTNLSSYYSNDDDEDDDDDESLLPLPYLTPVPMLGGRIGMKDGETQGEIYAAQIASVIARQAPGDRRQVVIGLAPELINHGEITKETRLEFLGLIKLVQDTRVW